MGPLGRAAYPPQPPGRCPDARIQGIVKKELSRKIAENRKWAGPDLGRTPPEWKPVRFDDNASQLRHDAQALQDAPVNSPRGLKPHLTLEGLDGLGRMAPEESIGRPRTVSDEG